MRVIGKILRTDIFGNNFSHNFQYLRLRPYALVSLENVRFVCNKKTRNFTNTFVATTKILFCRARSNCRNIPKADCQNETTKYSV